MPISARIDFLLFLLKIKPCLRTRIDLDNDKCDAFLLWVKSLSFFCSISHYDFLYISSDEKLLDRVITLDHSEKAHEKELGSLLGYPSCCTEKIAQVGERNIDDFESWLITQNFVDSFKYINPNLYQVGRAFISHVPCCTTCQSSLFCAEEFIRFLLKNKNEGVFSSWVNELGINNDNNL